MRSYAKQLACYMQYAKCGIVLFDASERVMYTNTYAQNIFRFRPKVGAYHLDDIINLFENNDRQKVRKRIVGMSAAPADGKSGSIALPELRWRKKYYEVSLTSLFSASHKNVGGVLAFHDISHFEEMDRMKDEFLSIASHELRTPMTAIMGNVDMVLKGQAGVISEEVEEYLEDVLIGADRLIALVNDMLDVSRLEASRMKFQFAAFAFADVASMVINDLQLIARAKNLKLSYRAAKKLPAVFADKNKVVQILNNIVGNALKFTDRGEVTVNAAVKKNMLMVDVLDTGIGIAHADQRKIFKKFAQLDASAEREAKGTGLGLYITKHLVEKLGGEVSLKSRGKSHGSTFHFSLPLANSRKARLIAAKIAKQEQKKKNQQS